MNPEQPLCYHCGLPVPSGSLFTATVLGVTRQLCCHGCQAVAAAIAGNGLEDYYRYRTEMPRSGEDLIPEELSRLDLYDHPEVQKGFVYQGADQIKQASLILEGINCAACIWLNERHLRQLPGVHEVAVNYASQRARISWDENQIKFSRILAEIRRIGYNAHPFSARQQDELRQKQRKQDIRYIAVAGLAGGQVMMLAVALYAGAAQGMEPSTTQLLRWFSLLLTIPVIVYAAQPFYRAAWSALLQRQVNMDTSVSLGLLGGFFGSVWATMQGHGVVYYDTITMLTFFLLVTRFFERNAREKSVEAAENLLRLMPALAMRMNGDQPQLVAMHELKVGDLILAKPGETIAADGVVTEGESDVDESLLTGESRPLPKSEGNTVLAGSINSGSPLVIRVTGVGEDTVLAGISRLLDRAQSEKPRMAQIADRIASRFTYTLLVLVLVTGLVWWHFDASRAFEIMLAVLVVGCPCALALAAPAAFAAAGSHLIKHGVLLTHAHALETLAKVCHFVFDKTGTLTIGKPVLLEIHPVADLEAPACLQIAAALEQASEHPLAQGFLQATGNIHLPAVASRENLPGKGVSGVIEGRRYTLGNASLTPALASSCRLDAEPALAATLVWLCDETRVLAGFMLADAARPQAAELIAALRAIGMRVSIFSGDSSATVQHFAATLGVDDWRAEFSPQAKLNALRALQQRGEIVAMTGDGINDAPVMAGAQVSLAMGSGTQLARASGDIILLTGNLLEVAHAAATSRLTMSIVRQNFIWAVAYNLVAVPIAATGHLSPLAASIGMSLSSLVVVLNALRLR